MAIAYHDSKNSRESNRYAPREYQAEKIITIIQDALGTHHRSFRCLDIGCSNGAITYHLASSFGEVIGVDIERTLIQKTCLIQKPQNLEYLVSDGTRTPFPAASFDVIVCAQVYEHTVHQQELADEIWRILKPTGICFFSGPNRFVVMEEHYWLPFLSWIPRPLAHRYMQLFHRGREYDIHPLSARQLKQLLKAFIIHDYTIKILRDPKRYKGSANGILLNIAKRLPNIAVLLLSVIVPNFNWVLEKRDNGSNP